MILVQVQCSNKLCKWSAINDNISPIHHQRVLHLFVWASQWCDHSTQEFRSRSLSECRSALWLKARPISRSINRSSNKPSHPPCSAWYGFSFGYIRASFVLGGSSADFFLSSFSIALKYLLLPWTITKQRSIALCSCAGMSLLLLYVYVDSLSYMRAWHYTPWIQEPNSKQ